MMKENLTMGARGQEKLSQWTKVILKNWGGGSGEVQDRDVAPHVETSLG